MKVQGKCHCGSITYEAEIDPAGVSVCHCTDCQMLTGSAYRVSVRAAAETLRMLSGEPKRYIKTAESGAKRAHWFCAECSTPVYASAVENPTAYSLRIACLAQAAQLRPHQQIWCRSAVPWSQDLGDVPKVDTQ